MSPPCGKDCRSVAQGVGLGPHDERAKRAG
jgi:hypothetical protein